MNINVAKRNHALFIAILIGVAPALANSHGPVFGLTTPTNAKCGWSLDFGVMGRAGSEDTGTMSRAMLSYAITEDVQVSFSAPAIFHPPGKVGWPISVFIQQENLDTPLIHVIPLAAHSRAVAT